MREPVRSSRWRGLKGATDRAQARGRAARQQQQWLSSRQSSPLRAVKPAGKGTPARAQSSAVAGNDDFRLDEGPGFRGKSDRQIVFPRLRPERAPPHQGGFRVSGLLDLLAESQITATPRHSAPGAGACQPAQRSGHQGRRLVWGLPRLASVPSTGIHDDRRSAACSRPAPDNCPRCVFSSVRSK